ncbi:hypothetical protein XELAEV_18020493mg [Xenopus laevis]|uniref:Uncharacterized protein n=1 Tax=Xenopus laevis TaxID=8355 RepID=A0A974D7X6_XENLA|nr:hypothetical protein XELAEV_18020493mg [Xenopus laevis]
MLLQQCQLASVMTPVVTSLLTAEPPGSPFSSGSASDVAIQRTPATRGPGTRQIIPTRRATRGKQAARKRSQMSLPKRASSLTHLKQEFGRRLPPSISSEFHC